MQRVSEQKPRSIKVADKRGRALDVPRRRYQRTITHVDVCRGIARDDRHRRIHRPGFISSSFSYRSRYPVFCRAEGENGGDEATSIVDLAVAYRCNVFQRWMDALSKRDAQRPRKMRDAGNNKAQKESLGWCDA